MKVVQSYYIKQILTDSSAIMVGSCGPVAMIATYRSIIVHRNVVKKCVDEARWPSGLSRLLSKPAGVGSNLADSDRDSHCVHLLAR